MFKNKFTEKDKSIFDSKSYLSSKYKTYFIYICNKFREINV
jgi:hypothetical protein